MKTRDQVTKLCSALFDVRRGYTKDKDTGRERDHCWCDMAADSPTAHEHSYACQRARALLEEMRL
jgi:hypothetical protein